MNEIKRPVRVVDGLESIVISEAGYLNAIGEVPVTEIAACINLAPRAMELLRRLGDVVLLGFGPTMHDGEQLKALLAEWDAASKP